MALNLPRLSGDLGLEAVEGLGDQLLVPVAVELTPDDLLGGLDDHLGDLAAHLAQGRVSLALYLLAGALDDAVALLARLALGALALSLALLARLVQDLARLAAGLVDLRLAVLDLVPDRRVDVAVEQKQEDHEGDDLPEDQARVKEIEYRAKHVLALPSNPARGRRRRATRRRGRRAPAPPRARCRGTSACASGRRPRAGGGCSRWWSL